MQYLMAPYAYFSKGVAEELLVYYQLKSIYTGSFIYRELVRMCFAMFAHGVSPKEINDMTWDDLVDFSFYYDKIQEQYKK